MPDDVSYCKNGNSGSIRSLVFEKLNENPLQTAKNLCKLLDLPYPQHRNYVAKLRHEWKHYARAFAKSNGVIVKVGDTWHPNSVEVIACYPDWAERNERVLEQLSDTLRQLFSPTVPKSLEKDVGHRV
jgi:hypothetical protein